MEREIYALTTAESIVTIATVRFKGKWNNNNLVYVTKSSPLRSSMSS